MTPPSIRRIGTTRDRLGESPYWDDEAQALCWIDALAGVLHRLWPATGEAQQHALPAPLGSIAPCASGAAAVVALGRSFARYDFATRQLRVLAAIGVDHPDVRLNDGKCDAFGNFVAGTLHANRQPGDAVQGGLYRLRPDATVEHLDPDIGFANGPCFSPDGRTLYLADSLARTIWAYDYDPHGPLANKRVFVDTRPLEAGADGAAVDVQGHLWSVLTRAAQLARFAPDGRLDRLVDLPVTYPTSLCFAGPGRDHLYLTTISRSERLEGPRAQDGWLFRIDGLPAPGAPVHRFADDATMPHWRQAPEGQHLGSTALPASVG